jgi:hypothetical protein
VWNGVVHVMFEHADGRKVRLGRPFTNVSHTTTLGGFRENFLIQRQRPAGVLEGVPDDVWQNRVCFKGAPDTADSDSTFLRDVCTGGQVVLLARHGRVDDEPFRELDSDADD